MSKIKCLVESIGSVNTNRVGIIKMIRKMTGMGLSESKQWVDAMVPTGPYLMRQHFILTEAQFGRLAAFILTQSEPPVYIKEVEEIDYTGADFTHLTH